MNYSISGLREGCGRHLRRALAWLFAAAALLALTPAGLAAPEKPMPIELEDFPGARAVFSSREQVSDYVLALGNYKKAGGMWRVKEQRLSGRLQRMTYQLPDNHSAREGYQFFVDQLRNHPVRELYTCSSRECGDSNSWAVNHFGVPQLYGLDQYQYYGAFELVAPEHAGVYVTLYSVLRGNKRVYTQVEILASDSSNRFQVAGDPATFLRQLKRDGFAVFAGLRAGAEDRAMALAPDHVEALADAMAREPQLQLALVGHNYERISLEEQRQRSHAYAELLRDALVERGVDKDRLVVAGLGGLAPAGRGDAEARLDVVLLADESAP